MNNTNSGVESFNLWTAYKSMFKKYAQFSGRSRRSEYWYALIMNWLIVFAAELIFVVPFASSLTSYFMTGKAGFGAVICIIMYVLLMLYVLALMVPALAMTFRRLHDTGKSGWYLLFGLIPLVGGIILLVFYFSDSQPGDNQYGPNPKGM